MSTPNTARRAGARAAAPAHTARRRPISPHRLAPPHRVQPRRWAALTAAVLTTMAATVILAPATRAVTSDRPAIENVWASQAVTDLTSGGSGTRDRLPADFAEVLGYNPDTVEGVLVNPDGGCSSPVPLPAEFGLACKAHDLGYDLLRYADRQAEPLGPWARQAIDATLDQRMRRACGARTTLIDRAGCFVVADVADAMVDLNSRRQHYGAPVVESPLGAPDAGGWLSGILGLGSASLVIVLAVLIDAVRRRAPRGEEAEPSHTPVAELVGALGARA